MKIHRQQRILDLIASHAIETQGELMEYLQKDGYQVTQATVSRDIRNLHLVKTLGKNGRYCYSAPSTETSPAPHIFNHSLNNAFISLEAAQNLVVIKTYPGLAQSVAVAIDALHISTILGCVAGDDTILVIARTNEAALDFIPKFKNAYSK